MHVIRLRGPWRVELRGPAGACQQRTVTAPVEIGALIPADFSGQVRLLRGFHRPTGLSEGDQLRLGWGDWPFPLGATLNGEPLVELSPGLADITGKLQPRNELVLLLAWPAAGDTSPPVVLLDGVRLEIEPADSAGKVD